MKVGKWPKSELSEYIINHPIFALCIPSKWSPITVPYVNYIPIVEIWSHACTNWSFRVNLKRKSLIGVLGIISMNKQAYLRTGIFWAIVAEHPFKLYWFHELRRTKVGQAAAGAIFCGVAPCSSLSSFIENQWRSTGWMSLQFLNLHSTHE
jgi:hypothetical protein